MDSTHTKNWTHSSNVSVPSLGSMSATDSRRPSNYTTTTSSTIPGLGAISGRVILSLGKATLRGAEFIITRRRLNTISAKFPHQNTDRIVGLDSMYEDILELSRPNMYDDTTRVRALTIILVQIGTYQTGKLTEHLVKWPYIEISLFISSLTDILDPLKLYSTRKEGKLSTMVQAYKRSLAIWESHSLEPFIIFLQVLAKKGDDISEAIAGGGVMDYLLRLYASNFLDPLAESLPADFYRTSTLYLGCNALLRALSDARNGLSLLCGHPFHVLWPNLPELPFTPAASDRIVHRAEIWKTLGNELILWRIRSIMELVMTWHRPYDQELAVDIVVDLLEFAGSEILDNGICVRALRALHRVIDNAQFLVPRAIHKYFTLKTPKYFTKLMSQIFVRVAHLMTPTMLERDTLISPWEEPQFRPFNEPFFKANYAFQITNLFIRTAQLDEGILVVVLDSDILGLLLLLLQQEFRGTQYFAPHTGDEPTKHSLVDFEFLAMIREHGLRKLYPPLSYYDPHYINLRRIILSRAFDVVLRHKKPTGETDNLNQASEFDMD